MEFLTPALSRRVAAEFGTPVFVYSEARLRRSCEQLLAFPHRPEAAFRVRYAMKANSNAALLRLVAGTGLGIDASSGYECERAMLAGVAPSAISISSQEFPAQLRRLHGLGVLFNACSLDQLRRFAIASDAASSETPVPVGVRFNPGVGSGSSSKTNVGGRSSSFGIWLAQLPEVKRLAKELNLRVERVHTHIGSGADPEIWAAAARRSLSIIARFPEATILNLGGGFKVQRMPGRAQIDLQRIGARVRQEMEKFTAETGRSLELEIEPGTWVVAGAGALLSTVQDLVHTHDPRARDEAAEEAALSDPGFSYANITADDQVEEGKEEDEEALLLRQDGGFNFLKLDAGMTEILRPTLYGAQHLMTVVPRHASAQEELQEQQENEQSEERDEQSDQNVQCGNDGHNGTDSQSGQDGLNIQENVDSEAPRHPQIPFVVVGHCCESGDLLTPADGLPEELEPRLLGSGTAPVRAGDLLVLDFAGAYCGSMGAKNYNSYPEAAEVLLRADGSLRLVRRRQTLEQILANELLVED